MVVRISKNRVALENIPLNEARSNIAMHATTMDLWAQPNVIDGTGSAVTITAIANAPQAGASRDLYPIVGSILTHGAMFDMDGAVNRTAAAGECWTFVAKSVNTYRVFVRKADGTAVASGAAPVFGRVVRTAGDITTTSTSLVDVTGATVTFTTGAFPCAVGCTGMVKSDTLGYETIFNIMVDGALELGTQGHGFAEPAASYKLSVSFSHQTADLTANSHTIKVQWMALNGGTSTILASTTNAFSFWANEIR